MSDKWPYEFTPRVNQSAMSAAYEILSLRSCVDVTCNQDWSVVLADRSDLTKINSNSTQPSDSNLESLDTFFKNLSVNLSNDTAAEQYVQIFHLLLFREWIWNMKIFKLEQN